MVVGTRPELIRLSCVIELLSKSSVVDFVLIHTGQNYDYELNEIFFEDLSIPKPNYFLNAVGDTAINTIGNIISKIEPILILEKPSAFLVLGDTNSCLCAIPAKKLRIPVFHMEAGNRCFDERVPEEINRRIVDHISDINLTYSSIAREYLLKEGLSSDRIIVTGSPMKEVLTRYSREIYKSTILTKLKLEKHRYILVSCHRDENIESDKNFTSFVSVLNDLAKRYKLPILMSTHPRTRNRIVKDNIDLDKLVILSKPFGFFDYVNLQINSKVVLSDSGTISEESSILNFPALNIREAHERPEAMEEASVMMVGLNNDRIVQGIEVLKDQSRSENRDLLEVNDYSKTNVSIKVLRILISYIDYINQNVWKKNRFDY